jgi:hypothetical protein
VPNAENLGKIANVGVHSPARASAALALALWLAGCAVYNTTADGAERDLMLRGYDPLSDFTAPAPQMGRPGWSARHRHGSYRFASAENRDRFLAAPERYAPQYGHRTGKRAPRR